MGKEQTVIRRLIVESFLFFERHCWFNSFR